MHRTSFKTLLAQHDLPQSFIYLAPILPIVQVMWADGRNQMPERAKLQLMLEEHCAALSEMADGMELVSKADREKFDHLFVASRPDFDLLTEFGEIATQMVYEEGSMAPPEDREGSLNDRDQLVRACMEIAAACAANHPSYGNEEDLKRIVDEERQLIVKVIELVQPQN